MSDDGQNQQWNGDQQNNQGQPQATGPMPQEHTGPMGYTAAGPQGAWQAQPTGAPTAAQSTDTAGFFKALFDVSFSHFITPKVVKFVYVISMAAIALVWLFMLFGAIASEEGLMIAVVLLLGPVIALLYLVFIRITLEFYLATVRMSEDIHHRLR